MHIQDHFEMKAQNGDGMFAIAFALMEIAEQQRRMVEQVARLGVNHADTPLGAIELLSAGINDGLANLTEAIADLSQGS